MPLRAAAFAVGNDPKWYHAIYSNADWWTLLRNSKGIFCIWKPNLRHADNEIIKMVYLVLCPSLITYCITGWGGAAKTNLKLERTQILKTEWGLPFLYATTSQLFILHMVSSMIRILWPFNVVNTMFFLLSVEEQLFFLFFLLYNKIIFSLNIHNLSKYDGEYLISNWLLQLDYSDLENLIAVFISLDFTKNVKKHK